MRVLHLDVDLLLAEDRRQPVELALGVGGAAFLERLADAAREAAGERDQALAVPLEQLPVDARLVVVALEVAEARELDQVPVALGRLGEERQVRVALLLGLAVVGDVDLAAEDRLHAVLLRLLDEVDRARERAVVGERDGRHLELRGPRGERRDAARPVEDRELGVDVEMDERSGFRHGKPIVLGGPDVPLQALKERRRAPFGALRRPRSGVDYAVVLW